jgi:hypothetical protein
MTEERKVICLHGCNQDAGMFKRLLKDYKKIGAAYNLTFVFVEAEHTHPLGGKTWYGGPPLDIYKIGEIPLPAPCWTAPTLERIHQIIEDEKAYALLGFSQGGNVVDTYLATYVSTTRIKYAAILSGYEFVDGNRVVVNTPLLNVYSEADTIVPAKFAPTHYNVIVPLKHDKGHKVPTSRPMIRIICGWLSGH